LWKFSSRCTIELQSVGKAFGAGCNQNWESSLSSSYLGQTPNSGNTPLQKALLQVKN
jgi:hypothetical protein